VQDDDKEHRENKRTEKMHGRDNWQSCRGRSTNGIGENQVLFDEKGENELKLLASLPVPCPVPRWWGLNRSSAQSSAVAIFDDLLKSRVKR
jgi:hypothetical protein